jgi:hypothetical protein
LQDRTARDAELEQRIKASIDLFGQYLRAGRIGDVRRVLLEKRISISTIRNWARNPSSIVDAYRAPEFAEAIGRLPKLSEEKRNDAYKFALEELNIERDTQLDLLKYNGGYRVIHDFRQVALNSILFVVKRNPLVPIFAFKYNNRSSQRGYCDGLVVGRHGRIILTGFSSSSIFHAVLRAVPNPKKNLVRGFAILEDVHTNEVAFSKIALVHSRAYSSKLHSGAVDFVSESFIEL